MITNPVTPGCAVITTDDEATMQAEFWLWYRLYGAFPFCGYGWMLVIMVNLVNIMALL